MRFLKHTIETPCVDHGKKGNKGGYQQIKRDGFYFEHRAVYAKSKGLTAAQLTGICVRHRCDNTRCIAEDHLLAGSWGDNNRDRAERGRSAKVRVDKRQLTDEDAAWIRANIVPGDREFGANALAKRFGVVRKTLYLLLHGRTYFAEAPC